jgi:hypothetical protein
MHMPPGESPPADRDDALGEPGVRAQERRQQDRRYADTVTESQSAYVREQHQADAEPGDASADVEEVRVHSNHPGRRSDTAGATDDVGAERAGQSAFTRAEQRTFPERNADAAG